MCVCCLSASLWVCSFVGLCLSVCPSFCVSVRPSDCLSVCAPACLWCNLSCGLEIPWHVWILDLNRVAVSARPTAQVKKQSRTISGQWESVCIHLVLLLMYVNIRDFHCTDYCVRNRFLIQCRMQGSLLPKILARALLLITEVIFVRHLFKAGKP